MSGKEGNSGEKGDKAKERGKPKTAARMPELGDTDDEEEVIEARRQAHAELKGEKNLKKKKKKEKKTKKQSDALHALKTPL